MRNWPRSKKARGRMIATSSRWRIEVGTFLNSLCRLSRGVRAGSGRSTDRPDIEIGHHVVRRAGVLNAEIAKRVDREGLAFLGAVLDQIDDQREPLAVLSFVQIVDDLRLFVVRSVENQRQLSAPATQQIRNVENPRVASLYSTHTNPNVPTAISVNENGSSGLGKYSGISFATSRLPSKRRIRITSSAPQGGQLK